MAAVTARPAEPEQPTGREGAQAGRQGPPGVSRPARAGALIPAPVGPLSTMGPLWRVGFSPAGDVMPDSLAQVLARGSHAVLGARMAEERRRERVTAIAEHLDRQIAEFLAICAAVGQRPPVTVRIVGRPASESDAAGMPATATATARATVRSSGWPGDPIAGGSPTSSGMPLAAEPDPLAWSATARGGAANPGAVTAAGDGGGKGGGRGAGTNERVDADPRRRGASRAARRPPQQPRRRPRGRRARVPAWPVLYWRNEGFLTAGRSLHLFIDDHGRTFEGSEDPGPATALDREIRAWPVDVPTVVRSMAEIDARRCAHQIVHAMAHLLWRAGVGA